MMTRRRLLGAAAALPVLGGPVRAPAATPVLRRGVNLSAWLQFDRRQVVTPDDLAGIRAAGFDHVRLCVDFEVLGWRFNRADVPGIAEVDRAIAMARDAGLAAVLDCHGNGPFQAALEQDAAVEAGFLRLWRNLARRYAAIPPRDLVFELLNEPQYYEGPARRWPVLQQRLLQAVRDAAPDHTVLVTGRKGSRIDVLDEVAEAVNVVAVFHFYAPYVVTHQGADWGFENTAIPFLRGVPYPAACLGEAQPRVAPGGDPIKAREALEGYAAEGWDAERIARALAPAEAWGRRTGLPVICNEFGVYRRFAPPNSRRRWIGDVRRALEARNIGWTVYDYADAFGIATGEGRRCFSTDMRRALGLDGDGT